MSVGQDFSEDPEVSITAIDSWLPQTQCTRCSYPRCRDYASALYRGETKLNRCPPGGENTIAGLANLLKTSVEPLDVECGTHQPRVLALIVESQCIGCKLCIQVCPVDAIVGRAKRMHTVIPGLCTGCELCLPACPVDCIELVSDTVHEAPDNGRWPDYGNTETRSAHQNTVLRIRRLQHIARQRTRKRNAKLLSQRERIRAEIRDAVERVKNKRAKK